MELFSSCAVWVGKPWRVVKPGVRHAGVIHAAFYEGKTQRNRLLMARSWQPRLFCQSLVIYLPSLHGQRALAILPGCCCETQLFTVRNRGGDACTGAESGWIKHMGSVFATVGAKDIFPPEVLTPTKEQK